MERIVFFNNEPHYVEDSKYIHTLRKKSTTPLYGIIEINGLHFKCYPAKCTNWCAGCHFYDEGVGCLETDLPCDSAMRFDFCNCIFVKHAVENDIPFKDVYTHDEVKELLKIRFKN
jgi:hypothetical protein